MAKFPPSAVLCCFILFKLSVASLNINDSIKSGGRRIVKSVVLDDQSVLDDRNTAMMFSSSHNNTENSIEASTSSNQTLGWIIFFMFILGALFVDMRYTVSKKSSKAAFITAAIWSVIWIILALLFGGFIYYWYGRDRSLLFISAYILERSLSLDNVFVFIVVLRVFKTPPTLQALALNGGIILALCLRAGAILMGTMLLRLFSFLSCFMGVFLIYTGMQLASEPPPSVGDADSLEGNTKSETESKRQWSYAERWISKIIPMTKEYDLTGKIFVLKAIESSSEGNVSRRRRCRLSDLSTRKAELENIDVRNISDGSPSIELADNSQRRQNGYLNENISFTSKEKILKWHATPIVSALCVIGVSDLVFAVDSIPAILSITMDPFVVITSNCFAVLGLRALFFLLAALEKSIIYLNYALSVILMAVGVKMILGCLGKEIHTLYMLLFMIFTLLTAVVASLIMKKKPTYDRLPDSVLLKSI